MRALSLLHLAAAVSAAALCGPAWAQATRTWVSGVGDDVNPCSRTAPCRTFAGAISKTAAGGEIDALDPGGFGTVTITKSITIDGGHALAGIEAVGNDGVVINAPASAVVVLRNLRIRSTANPDPAPAGIHFGSGAALHLEAVTITGFATGIDFRPASGGGLDARVVRIDQSIDAGIKLASGDAATPARATLSGVTVTGGDYGLLVTDNGVATLDRSVLSGATVAALAAAPSLGGDADLNVQDVVLSGAALGVGAQATAPGRAVVRLARLTALDGTPTAHVGLNGDIRSFGDNRLLAGPDFTLTVDPPEQVVSRGAAATFTVSSGAEGISPGVVSLSCEGLPGGARCEFSPATISPSGTVATSTLTISTDGSDAPSAMLTGAGQPGRKPGGGRAALALLPLGLLLAHRSPRRPWWRTSTLLSGVLAVALLGACGGGGGSHGVAPGTYQVTVRGAAGMVTHQTTLSLKVE